MAEWLRQPLGLYLLAVNLAAFVLMGLDKRRARRGEWRISEKALFLPAALGGALGGTLGMRAFHHKTFHRTFTFGVPLILALQIVIPFGLWLYFSVIR